ncbi:MAG: DUF3107 domain-containing protein [Micrococcales bacterium]|nr:DUF3107 domain-containing protein [Micrococcales bacterium]
MEITIGVQNLPREVTLDSDQTVEEVTKAVHDALSSGKGALDLTDQRGRRVIVPTAAIGYIEIGAETRGRVGFSSL